jgi:hypothetical protein
VIIKNNIIICNSYNEFYVKEELDLKNNTVRIVTNDEMIKIKKIWEENKQLQIQIINTDTLGFFIRYLRDVSFYCLHSDKWVVIFTWREDE